MDIHAIVEKYQDNRHIAPFEGSGYRKGGLAIIGQDPGITTSSRISKVLDLDREGSALHQYISKHILAPLELTVDQIVAFNLIDIRLSTSLHSIANRENYKFYALIDEMAEMTYNGFLRRVRDYEPGYIVSLGQGVFQFLQKKSHLKPQPIKQAFAGSIKMKLEGYSLISLPCVHVRTYNRYNYVYAKQDERLRKQAPTLKAVYSGKGAGGK